VSDVLIRPGRWWKRAAPTQRIQLVVILLAMAWYAVAFFGPYTERKTGDPGFNLTSWFIEDAAISFAYARNWAEGDGLVTWVGGERVEGFSNPLWVALLALAHRVGINPFVASKVIAFFLGLGTLPLVFGIARRALPERWEGLAALAPFFLATNAQFAIWNTSGLENSLFSFLLAAGCLRLLVELEERRFPLSAWLFVALSFTRPEAILYAAWAGFILLVVTIRQRRARKAVGAWLLAFFLPWGLIFAARWAYFGWPFPNTYYAKIGTRMFKPFHWEHGGWRYLRKWAWEMGVGVLYPVYLMAVVGAQRWRRFAGPLLGLAIAVIALIVGPEGLVDLLFGLKGQRIDVIASTWMVLAFWAAAILAPLFAIGSRGATARVLMWGMAFGAAVFTIRSGGDWMKGHRWGAFFAVPLSVLTAVVVGQLADWLRSWSERPPVRGFSGPEILLVLGCAVGWSAVNVQHLMWFSGIRETDPYMVRERVRYTERMQHELQIDDPVWNLDVDQGAHLYWSDHRMADIAGLVDVPMGHNRFQESFLREYLWGEIRPVFAHVHGSWANQSRIPRFQEWLDGYIEMPGYPHNRSRHIGNHLRRDVVLEPRAPYSQEAYDFAGGLRLVDVDAPARVASRGRAVFLEFGFACPDGCDEDPRVVAYLKGENGMHSFDVPLAHDLVRPRFWRDDEVAVTRLAVDLPADLPEGRYGLGIAVFGPRGVWAAEMPNPEPSFVNGELFLPDLLTIGPVGSAEAEAQQLVAGTVQAAAAGQCVDAESQWLLARRHVSDARMWGERRKPVIFPALTSCWLEKAENASLRKEKVAAYTRARAFDFRNAALQSSAAAFSAELVAAGDSVADHNPNAAYRAYADAVLIDPSNAWARTKAEEQRAIRYPRNAPGQWSKTPSRATPVRRTEQ